jgi:heat-inducible transcriptional repressor
MMHSPPELSERAQHMLKALIERYAREGQPVGSRTLAREAGLDLSPATIRNVMSDLEELGFVQSPHTSAGRVPTVQGYRFFVDTLLSVQPLESGAFEKIRAQLDIDTSAMDLLESATGLLSGITQLAGVGAARAGHSGNQRGRGAEPDRAHGTRVQSGRVTAGIQLSE